MLEMSLAPMRVPPIFPCRRPPLSCLQHARLDEDVQVAVVGIAVGGLMLVQAQVEERPVGNFAHGDVGGRFIRPPRDDHVVDRLLALPGLRGGGAHHRGNLVRVFHEQVARFPSRPSDPGRARCRACRASGS